MNIGIVGMGRMGAGLADRLQRRGHNVVGYDSDPARSPVESLQGLVRTLERPRLVWVMVPAGEATAAVVSELAGLLEAGDVLVDGGNSYYEDSRRRAADLAAAGIEFLDVGTSGGVWGAESGFCLMIGGSRAAFNRLAPLLTDLAPPGGVAYLGAAGAGHFAKMIHNGIEYGLLQAYAEGFQLLAAAEYDYDLAEVARLWNQGSVVRSWLLELSERALRADPRLTGLRGYVDDSGEGRWTILEAVRRGVPAGVLAQSLFARFASREEDSFAMRFIAALRRQFGGHDVRPR